MAAERIMTLHPQGRKGVSIAREHYDTVRDAILAALADDGEITFSELLDRTAQRLQGRFHGSPSWYTTVVKLDLEARGLIACDRRSRPQRIQLGIPD